MADNCAQVIASVENHEIKQVSKKLQLHIPDCELQQYADSVNKVLASATKVWGIPNPNPIVTFPRTPGYRPSKEENPYNAWFIKSEIKGSPSGVLSRMRIVINDCIAVAGVPMMNGSSLLEGHVPDYDATVVTRILEAGGTIVGKANCENFCSSANSFDSVLGPVRNPLSTNLSAGGSSSGSAALIAAGEADMSVGTDLGGSLRVPAAYCGIVGLKPTHGLVPYTGAMGTYAPMDHLGPMAKTVEDTARILQVIAGPDGLDARQYLGQPTPKNYLEEIEKGVKGLTIGVVKEAILTNDDHSRVIKSAIGKLEKKGCTIKDISVPWHGNVGDFFPHIATPACYDSFEKGAIVVGNGGWHDVGLAHRMQLALKSERRDLTRSMKLTCVLGEILKQKDNHKTFAKAENLVPVIRKAYDDAMSDCDVMVLPTTPDFAPLLPTSDELQKMPLEGYMDTALAMTKNTSPFNITGHPALAVPVGVLPPHLFGHSQNIFGGDPSDEYPCCLSAGVMVVGRHYQEDIVFRVGKALEWILKDCY